MVAIADEDEVHVAAAVRSWISPLAKVPVAVNCTSMVAGMVEDCGVIRIEVSAAPSTTRFAVAPTDPDWAVMVVVPADWPVATPAVLTVATLVLDEIQVT